MAMPTRPTSPDPSGDTPRASAFSGLGAGLDFFQDWLKAAGSALPNMPGHTANPGLSSWAMPTLDPEELDKRIQDLKTVQFWLEQNSRMVAMTIQGLEVQKMTLSTLKGMNVSMDSLRDALKARNVASDMAAAFAATTAPPASSPASPFASRPSAPPAPEPEATGSDDPPADTASAASSGDASAGAGAGAELINPMRWWDTLTEQFTHLASQASQTAQTVGTSMSDLLAQTQQAANASTAAATEASAQTASASQTAAGKSPARKTAPKATPKAPAKPAAKG